LWALGIGHSWITVLYSLYHIHWDLVTQILYLIDAINKLQLHLGSIRASGFNTGFLTRYLSRLLKIVRINSLDSKVSQTGGY
jgi:hypothetical protein